jgi:hypothetical protein
LIYLNSSAGQSEKDEGGLGTGKIGAIVGCVIGQHEVNKAGAIGSKDFGLVDERRSSLIVKITGAPMRRKIDWIVGTDETVLDVAIVGLVAILGPSLLRQLAARRDRMALSVLALQFRALRSAMPHSSHRRGDRVKALFAAVQESGSGALLGHGAMSALSP